MDLSNENVVHIKKGNVEYIQFRRLLEYDKILKHAFSVGLDVNFRTQIKRKDGNIEHVNYEKAVHDYDNLCKCLDLDMNNLIYPNQLHTDNIQIVNKKINRNKPDIYNKNYLKTDGLLTIKKDMILATTCADCILILFFDPVTKSIANIHSGWMGTYNKIVVKTVLKMEKDFGVNPKNLICCMCPSIRSCHFEVRKDVKDLFFDRFKEIDEKYRIIKSKSEFEDEKWYIDTIKLNKIMLLEKGLKLENIIDSNICTVCNSKYIHSYRVEKEKFGLETAIISLI